MAAAAAVAVTAAVKLMRARDGKYFAGQTLGNPMVTSDPGRAKVVDFEQYRERLLGAWRGQWEIVRQPEQSEQPEQAVPDCGAA